MSARPRFDPHVIDDPVAVDAINDPLRWRIFNQVHSPKTVQELGQIFGMQPSRLYYHLNLLEKHGWVRVVEERRTSSNTTERIYGPGFEGSFVLSEAIMSAPSFNTDGWQIGELADQFAPFERNLDLALEHGYPPEGRFGAIRRFPRLSAERAEELCEKIEALIAEYAGPPEDDGRTGGPGDRSETLHGLLFLCQPFVELPSHLRPSAPG